MDTAIIFINEENSLKYKNEVLAWLKSDFDKKGHPERSFYHNRGVIAKSFDKGAALVAVKRKKVVGYMIWSKDGDSSRAEIDIVEVKASYRRKGIFTQMLSEFKGRYTNVSVLTLHAIPEAERFFETTGWAKTIGVNNEKCYYKLIRPVLPLLTELPDGDAVAVYSQADASTPEWVDAYRVMDNPEKYPKKYFKMDLDVNNKLRVPLFTPFHYEGYVGVYHNKKLITEGKAKYVFEDDVSHWDFLVIDKLTFREPSPLVTTGFFSQSTSSASASHLAVMPAERLSQKRNAPDDSGVEEKKASGIKHRKI